LSLLFPGEDSADVDAFVLAGGRSSRMGQDKAFMQLSNTPLIQHALEILRAVGINARIAGANSDLSRFAPIISDEPLHAALGPLSGVCSALSEYTRRYNVFLPVDMPLIPSSLILYLVHHAAITESLVTVASVGGFIQTFPAIIDRSAAPSLRNSLRSNRRGCLTAFQVAASAESPFTVLPTEVLLQAGAICHPDSLPPSQWFLNVNTIDDLANAEALLAGRHQVS
jgi:molybdenum cofactor guanylyltransferase